MEGAQQAVDKTIEAESNEPTPKGALIGGLLAVAFGAVCGAAIGYGLVDIGCHGKCGAPRTIGTLLGASFGALGVSIVAVLVMRALVEWRRHQTRIG